MGSCHPGKWVCDLYPPLSWIWMMKIRKSLLLEDLEQLASALACEARHSSIPLQFFLSVLSKTSWKSVKKTQFRNINLTFRNVVILVWIQRSKMLRLPFSVLGFWHDVHCWFFYYFIFFKPQVGKVCQLPENNVSALVQLVQKNFKGTGADQIEFFLRAVNTPDKDPAIRRRYVMCRKQERHWGKQQRQDQSVNPSEWPQSFWPLTS